MRGGTASSARTSSESSASDAGPGHDRARARGTGPRTLFSRGDAQRAGVDRAAHAARQSVGVPHRASAAVVAGVARPATGAARAGLARTRLADCAHLLHVL